MSTAWAWFTKEWRAQWLHLAAFTLLGCAALAIVTMCLAATTWRRTELGPQVMSWFLLMAAGGVLVIAAPQLVRSESETGSDELLRRLPGAFASAWVGKVAFLVCASGALLGTGWLCGTMVLWWHGEPGVDFVVRDAVAAEGVTVDGVPIPTVLAIASVLLAPWVAAAATCLPRGHIAVMAIAALAAAVGLGVDRVLQQCPGLRQAIDWLPWIAAVWPAGAALFAFVWSVRRRGAQATAWRHGLAGCCALLAVPAAALGNAVWKYRDPGPVALLAGLGVTPDGRFALAYASPHADGRDCVTLRIDLECAAAARIGGVQTRFEPGTTLPWPIAPGGCHRFWRWHEGGTGIFDAEAGRRLAASEPESAALAAELRADVRAFEAIALPRGDRVWRDGDGWMLEHDGELRFVPWPLGLSRTFYRCAGQGVFGGDERSLFDFERRAVVRLPQHCEEAIAVGREWLCATQRGRWYRFDPERGTLDERPELDGAAGCRGPVGDGRVLLLRGSGQGNGAELLVHRPADRSLQVLPLPPGFEQPTILVQLGADAHGRTWIGSESRAPIALDPDTARLQAVPVASGVPFALIGNDVFTVEAGRRIVRTDYATGARAVLYPVGER